MVCPPFKAVVLNLGGSGVAPWGHLAMSRDVLSVTGWGMRTLLLASSK